MRMGIMLSICIVWFSRTLSLRKYSSHSSMNPKAEATRYNTSTTVMMLPAETSLSSAIFFHSWKSYKISTFM
jgi:hypothetical protein